MLDRIQWGPVSDWVSGLATLLAVAIALTFSLRSDQRDRENALAAVYSWLTISAAGAAVLWLRNATAAPIYQWSVTLTWTDVNGTSLESKTGSGEYGILPPGDYDFPIEDDRTLPVNDAHVGVHLRFRDAAGRALHRTPTGALIRDREL